MVSTYAFLMRQVRNISIANKFFSSVHYFFIILQFFKDLKIIELGIIYKEIYLLTCL